MNRKTARSLALVGLFVLPVAVAGCSDDSDTAATSSSLPDATTSSATSSSPTSSTASSATSTSSTSSTSTPTSTSSTSTSAAPTSSGPTTGTSSSSSTSSSSTGSSSSSSTSSSSSVRPLDTALADSCVQSLGKITATNRDWNAAKRNGSPARLDRAARTLGVTAGELRIAARQSDNDGFATRARAVAGDLESMQRSWTNDKKVVSEQYNEAWRGLRSYCTRQLQP